MKVECFGREIDLTAPTYGVTQVLTSAEPQIDGVWSADRLPDVSQGEHRAYWTWVVCGHLFASVFQVWPTNTDAEIQVASDAAHRRLVAYVHGLLQAGMRPDEREAPVWVGEVTDNGPMPVPEIAVPR